jgi:two-component system nitrogen regulation sensor histidine kinase NtrY
MAYRRLALAALAQIALVIAAIGVVAAARSGLYATASVLALACLWIGAESAFRLADHSRAAVRIEPAATPSQAARAELAMLRALIDQLPTPIVTADAAGRLEAVNLAARRMFGAESLIVEAPAALVAAMTAPGAPPPQVLSLPKDGETRRFAVSITDAFRGGEAARLAVLSDVQSELRAMEAQALRELLQVLGHEIMNSLTPVASLAESAEALLEDPTPEATDAARAALRTIGRRALGLNRFVTGYRALARLPDPALRPEPARAVLEEAVRLFQARWSGLGVALTLRDDTEPGALFNLDRDMVGQALINLLSNAAEAALAGPRRPPGVSLTAEANGGGLDLRVADNGPGVPADEADAVFRPFFTTKPDGAGVGLSIARQIALSHGGDLVLLPGSEGATFVLRV